MFSREVRRVVLVGGVLLAVVIVSAIVSPALSLRLVEQGLPVGQLLAGLLLASVSAVVVTQLVIVTGIGGNRPASSPADWVWLLLPLALVMLTGVWLWSLGPLAAPGMVGTSPGSAWRMP